MNGVAEALDALDTEKLTATTDGHVFKGWSTDDDDEVECDAGSVQTFTEDKDLYAVFGAE